jgi:hypothetical protein
MSEEVRPSIAYTMFHRSSVSLPLLVDLLVDR